MRAMVMIGADFTEDDFRDVLQVAEEGGPAAVDAGKLVEALTRASDVGVIEVELID